MLYMIVLSPFVLRMNQQSYLKWWLIGGPLDRFSISCLPTCGKALRCLQTLCDLLNALLQEAAKHSPDCHGDLDECEDPSAGDQQLHLLPIEAEPQVPDSKEEMDEDLTRI